MLRVDPVLAKQFQNTLLPGERLIWTGTPKQGIAFRPADIFLIPFSILWFGFAIFWNWMVMSGGGPNAFNLFGSIFLVVGFYITFGRFLFDAFSRSRTSYALSDQRVLINGGVFNPSLTTIDIKGSSDINLSGQGQTRGSIRFGSSSRLNGFHIWHSYDPEAPQLFQILDADLVHREIQKLKQQGR